MKLRSIAIFLAVALASAAAHAQAGVYTTFDAQMFSQSGIYANPGTHTNVDSPWLFGPTYGVYFTVTHVPKFGALRTGPVLVGIDVRGDTLRLREYGSQLDRQDGLFSLRVSPRSPFLNSTPYLQGGFGIGHTRIPFASTYTNNFVYQFGGGLDRRIRGRFDWRVEATTGFLGNYTVGAGPNQSNFLITLGTGLVIRLDKERATK